MRQKIILIVSVGLNVAFATIWLFSRHSSLPSTSEDVVSSTGSTNAGKTQVVVRRQFFSWQELETPDYTAYVSNLRLIGCPEPTIRDIIVADVNQLYAKKRSNDVVAAEQQWWRAEPDPSTDVAAAAKVQALDAERRALLANLLGPNWDNSETNQAPRSLVALTGPLLGELSPETKLAVQEISTRSQQRGAAYLETVRKDGKEQDPVEVARLRQQTREELARVLTPPQLEEFLLRYSANASALRKDLRGFELSPDEFRNLFRALDPIDQQLQLNYSGVDPTSTQQRALLQKQRDDVVKLALGPDRFREYQLARDSALRDAVTATQAAGAPAQTVQTVYQINQATIQEQQRIQNDATLTAEEKAAQLSSVNQEQKSARDRVLGLAPATPSIPPQPPGLNASQTYNYRPGETVDQIANRYGVSPGAIFNANPAVDFNLLQRGQKITIPPPLPPLPPPPN